MGERDARFGKSARLRRRGEFLAVQQRGRKIQAGALVVLALPGREGWPRLGITVSSRVGSAVVRNRVKRWVRESFRAVAADLPPVDLVVVARPGAGRLGLAGVRAEIEAAGMSLRERRR